MERRWRLDGDRSVRDRQHPHALLLPTLNEPQLALKCGDGDVISHRERGHDGEQHNDNEHSEAAF